MKWTARLVTAVIGGLVRLPLRVDDAAVRHIPSRGPLLIVVNHVNFLDVPVLYTCLVPRPMAGFAKVETWDNPFLGYLADIWQAIPVQRGEVDRTALRQGLDVLQRGDILAIAPEGTRSGDGQLQRAYPGVTLLALQSAAPILPVVYYGHENFRQNLRHLRRTDFHVAVGRPFTLAAGDQRVTHAIRQEMTDQILGQMAALLPPQYRGVYAAQVDAPAPYVRFV